jgi:hypothetical protein
MLHTCGFAFCKACLDDYLKKSPNCPQCKQKIKNEEIMPALAIKKIISNLILKCPNHKNGCSWEGVHSKFNDHYIKCVPEKKQSSGPKLMTCIACLTKYDINKAKEHQEECDFQKVPCENGCSKKIAKRNMKFHVNATCMLIVQKCSFEPYGCSFTGRTGDVIKHVEDAASEVYHTRLVNEFEKKNKEQMLGLLKEIKTKLDSKPRSTFCNVSSSLKQTEKMIKKTKPILDKNILEINKDNLILPKLNVNVPPKKKKISFSNFRKGDNLKVFNNGLSIVGISKAYEVAQLSEIALPYQTFTFSIDFLNAPIAIGLGDTTKLLGNNYTMRYNMINHGCFLLGSTGYHLVDNRAGFFNPGKSMSFKQGDIVSFVYEYDRSRIVFTKAGSGEGTAVYLPQIIDPNNLRPTVFVYDNLSQVTFLQSSN